MNWSAWAPTLVTIVVALVTYGRYIQTQTDHGKRLDGLDGDIESHMQHLSRIDVALVRLEEYNRGFADATRLGGK